MSEDLKKVEGQPLPPADDEIQSVCPKCGHSWWHRIADSLKRAGESIGNAIGEAKFGE
jgi:hypothetical protein